MLPSKWKRSSCCPNVEGKRSAWCGTVEEEDVCLVWSYGRGRGLPGVVLSKGKRSAWFEPVEEEEVCLVCAC